MTPEEAAVIAERICADAKERKRAKGRAACRAWYWRPENLAPTRKRARENALKRKFNMSNDGRERLLKDQAGACAICPARISTELRRSCHVDHCHTTGAVRGLLCQSCNLMLGHAKDNIGTLQAAIAYLQKFTPTQPAQPIDVTRRVTYVGSPSVGTQRYGLLQ